MLYLANATRPDITYAVNVLSRHQINPTENELKMTKRVFNYLKGTRDLSLIYRSNKDGMQAFSDASDADCKGSLTTSGYLINLFGNPVAWRSHKQSYVALSTCEAEYVAMGEACQEIMATGNTIDNLLEESIYPVQLFCDNVAAISSGKTIGSTKLRHMTRIKADYVKECIRFKRVELQWIRSKDQLADIFTKPLPFLTHANLTKRVLNYE